MTLSSVLRNCKDLNYSVILIRLKPLLPNSKVLFVKEYHKSPEIAGDYHYHVMIISTKGLSKNTYHKVFRETFPEFTGISLDVGGIKSNVHTINYLLKSIPLIELLEFINGSRADAANCEYLKVNDKKY